MKPSNDREAITLILEGLTKVGCKITGVCDDTYNPNDLTECTDVAKAVDLVCAVDEASVFMDLPPNEEGHKESWIFFVLGNEPEEVACDHGVNLSPYINPIVQPWWS
jgi:hypothetical protein